jgi:DNA-binding CsgD family transcriptional regulator
MQPYARLRQMSRTGERMEAVIDVLYLAAADPAAWPKFLASAARFFDAGPFAGLILESPSGTGYLCAAAIGVADDTIRLYNNHYAALDPWYLALRERGIKEWIGPGSDLCPPLLVENSEYYNDFRKQTSGWYQGGIFQRVSGVSSVLTMHRSRRQRDFDHRDTRLLRGLSLHLRRALTVHQTVIDLRNSIAQVAGVVDALDVGLLGLGKDRKICFANAHAEGLLRPGDVLIVRNGQLFARDSQSQIALDRLVTNAFSRTLSTLAGGALTVANGDRRLLLTVLPANRYLEAVPGQSAVFLTIVDPEARPRSRSFLLSALFGLTPAEARVAMLLLQGFGPNEIARRTQTTTGTVRFQLKMVYRKTGVARQSQLVRLLSCIPGVSEPDPLR